MLVHQLRDCEGLLGKGEFFFNYFFMSLGESGFSFDAEAASVVEELIDGFIGDFPVEQFA